MYRGISDAHIWAYLMVRWVPWVSSPGAWERGWPHMPDMYILDTTTQATGQDYITVSMTVSVTGLISQLCMGGYRARMVSVTGLISQLCMHPSHTCPMSRVGMARGRSDGHIWASNGQIWVYLLDCVGRHLHLCSDTGFTYTRWPSSMPIYGHAMPIYGHPTLP